MDNLRTKLGSNRRKLRALDLDSAEIYWFLQKKLRVIHPKYELVRLVFEWYDHRPYIISYRVGDKTASENFDL